jgi:hypothetical protein
MLQPGIGLGATLQAPVLLSEDDAQFYEARKKKVQLVVEEAHNSLTGELDRITGALSSSKAQILLLLSGNACMCMAQVRLLYLQSTLMTDSCALRGRHHGPQGEAARTESI